MEAVRGIETLGRAVQKVHDDGKLFKSSWRDKNKMRRAIISTLARLFIYRYRKGLNDPLANYGEFEKLVVEAFSALYEETKEDCTDYCPDEKTIKDELKKLRLT